MKRAMYGTRWDRVSSRSTCEAGHESLKVCHQAYYWLEAAIHGDDIIAEGEPEELDRLDEVLQRLVVVKVLDRVGPGTSRVRASNAWKIRSTLLRSSRTVPKSGRSRRSRWAAHTWVAATLKRWTSCQSWRRSCTSKIRAAAFTYPVGASTSSSVRRLSEMMSKPRRMGDLRLAKQARYLAGTQKISLRFAHQECGDLVRIFVDSDPVKDGGPPVEGLKPVRVALLAKGPDSSLGEVHRGSCSGDIHMEEAKVEVKVQVDEVEYGRDNEECKARVEERTDHHSSA